VRARLAGIAALASVALVAGCSVVPLPKSIAAQGQSPRDQDWDIKDCQAEAGYQTGYSPTDSPLGNFFQKVFFWGGAGASLGGLITGLPASVTASQASEGLIAGAGAGGITGTIQSWSGQSRFERAWVACMQSRGYTIVPREEAEKSPSVPSP
jgi:hypothetical protein